MIDYLEAAMLRAIEGDIPTCAEVISGMGMAFDRYSWPLDGDLKLGDRRRFIDRYSFAIPSQEAINAIAAHGPVVEVGAGTGLWARLVSHLTPVVATDIADGRNSYRQDIGTWHPVDAGLKAEAAIQAYPDRSVLMVWPNHNRRWAWIAAKAMLPGSVLCYVGEGAGGCTGCGRFHRYLDKAFDNVATVQIPQFFGIHDELFILRKTK